MVDLRNVDLYLKVKARAEHPGTPEAEAANCRARMAEFEEEHPDIGLVAQRVDAAMRGPGPDDNPFADLFHNLPPPRRDEGFLERMARGMAAGMSMADQLLEDGPDGRPLPPGHVEVRVRAAPGEDELRVRARARLSTLTHRVRGPAERRALVAAIADRVEAWFARA